MDQYLVAALCASTLPGLTTLGQVYADLERQWFGFSPRFTCGVDGHATTHAQRREPGRHMAARSSVPIPEKVQLDQELLSCADFLHDRCGDNRTRGGKLFQLVLLLDDSCFKTVRRHWITL
ncbi:MAG: hypothetical protein J3Q66DRAFT_36712 [Benniella sp.]|nr:MAG: hypothetical protein J3Q66DRAFT_36712 [Benniella sp.]